MNQAIVDAKRQMQNWHQWQDAAVPEAAADLPLSRSWQWFGFEPLGTLNHREEFLQQFWRPLRQALSGFRRETHILLGGFSSGKVDGSPDGALWTGATGWFHGRLEHEWLGIRGSGEQVQLRWAEFHHHAQGVIQRTYLLVDLIDLLEQLGCSVLPRSRGAEGVYPPPLTGDGRVPDDLLEDETQASLRLIREFLFEGLNRFDQSQLQSMGVARYFHPAVRWYGPGGIGFCNGLQEFEDLHQKPWLHAFPDRKIQDLDSLFAEGAYVGSSGWDGVIAVHSGEYLQTPASGNRISFNGIDFWRREGDQFVENWVFVDMIHLFRQFGVDLLARVQRSGRTSGGA